MKRVNISQIRKTAEDYYRSGDFYCSEAIIKTLKDEFAPEVGDEVVALASGFPVGMGGAGCTCGAVVGGQMSLGLLFGRSKAKGKEVKKSMELSKELHDKFKEKNNILCCKVLTKGMKMGSKDHMEQCIRFTGEMAEETAKIIARELKLTCVDGDTIEEKKLSLFKRIFK